MIILDKKSYELLFYLLKLEEPETVMTISKKLNQSRRKIYYHLDKINDALPKSVPQIIAYPRVGILLTDEQKLACQALLDELDDYSYVLNVNERLELILTLVAVSAERVTIEKLMTLTDVSRNTVLNDLNLIRQNLAEDPHGIILEVSKADGYYLKAKLLTKIRFLYRLLHGIYTKGNANFVQILRDKVNSMVALPTYFSDEVLCYFQEQLAVAKESLGKKLNSQEGELMQAILPYLLNSYRSYPMTDEETLQIQQEFALAQQRKEYQIAKDMATSLNKQLGLVLDDVEISLIAMLLLSYRKDSDSHLESRDYAQMRQDLEQFVAQFENHYHLTFSNKDDLLRQLLTHCKSLIYRKAYGVLSSNPLTEHIMDNYAELFYMTKTCVPLLQDAWAISLTDDDIAYITVHIGGALRQSQTTVGQQIILVCDEGIGVQKLFLSQCRKYLKTAQIEAVFTSEQFDSVRDILTADMVITTVELTDSPVPTLVVTPILSHEDIVRMVRFVSQAGESSCHDVTQELERYIRQHLKDDTEVYLLRNKLEKLLSQEILSAIAVTQGHA